MTKKTALIAAGAAVMLLITAACGSKSTASTATTSAASAAASGAMTSGAMTSSAMTSGAMTSGAMTSGAAASGAMSSGAMTSGAADSGAMSSAAGSASASGGTTVGDTTGTLDAASTTWFTALCTGLSPLSAETAKITAASASGTDAEKLKAVSPSLTAIGTLYGGTGTTLTALPSPGIPNGSEYAEKTIAAFGELADLFTAAGTSTASGSNAKLATLQTDASAGPAVQAAAKLTLTSETKAAINKIPVCASSGVIS